MSSLLGNLQMLQAKVIARVPSYYFIKRTWRCMSVIFFKNVAKEKQEMSGPKFLTSKTSRSIASLCKRTVNSRLIQTDIQREEFDLVWMFLMEYGSGIIWLLICPLQASLVLSSKKIEPSPEGLRKDVLAKDAGDRFIAMYANHVVDCCFIPESPFYLEGVAGQFGNKILPYVSLRISQNLRSLVYDPVYMIWAVPSNASNNLCCIPLCTTFHGARAGYTSFTVGPINRRHAYIPYHCETIGEAHFIVVKIVEQGYTSNNLVLHSDAR
ncbi:hypothetical protein SO802_008023 [Lithocarpus litseifolius]|uniref:Uncharacterized protein n=1 Tax=Lithocarpus litseifolius TaxID=425828 RepID=A0AAW2DQB7_9ROSI